MTDTAETGTALVSLSLNLPEPAFVAEQVSKAYGGIFNKIEEEIANFVPDVTTEKGRKEIASFSYKIARTKNALDEAAKNVTADQKAIIDAVNAERSKRWDEIEALQKKARAPLDAWEAAEKARQDRVAAETRKLSSAPASSALMNAEQLREVINYLDVPYSREEFGDDAHKLIALREETRAELERMIERRQEEERERAELEQLRREKAEREEADRLKREQEEAAEAARIAEEERKAKEEAEAKRQEVERARIAKEAEEKAAKDAAEKIAAEQKAREDAERRAEEAEAREKQRIEDEKRLAAELIEAQKEAAARAEEDAKRREEAAKEEERQRLAKIAAEKERADQERAADIAHRKKINSEAVAALVKLLEVNETFAQQIVIAIYKEQVPHVAISY